MIAKRSVAAVQYESHDVFLVKAKMTKYLASQGGVSFSKTFLPEAKLNAGLEKRDWCGATNVQTVQFVSECGAVGAVCVGTSRSERKCTTDSSGNTYQKQ